MCILSRQKTKPNQTELSPARVRVPRRPVLSELVREEGRVPRVIARHSERVQEPDAGVEPGGLLLPRRRVREFARVPPRPHERARVRVVHLEPPGVAAREPVPRRRDSREQVPLANDARVAQRGRVVVDARAKRRVADFGLPERHALDRDRVLVAREVQHVDVVRESRRAERRERAAEAVPDDDDARRRRTRRRRRRRRRRRSRGFLPRPRRDRALDVVQNRPVRARTS
eukprot:30973-Pelagococcus_subviridis.AAC.8